MQPYVRTNLVLLDQFLPARSIYFSFSNVVKAILVPYQATRQFHPCPSTVLFLPVLFWHPFPGPNVETNPPEQS
jgi:hypothetical protein